MGPEPAKAKAQDPGSARGSVRDLGRDWGSATEMATGWVMGWVMGWGKGWALGSGMGLAPDSGCRRAKARLPQGRTIRRLPHHRR